MNIRAKSEKKKTENHGKITAVTKITIFAEIAEKHGFRDFRDLVNSVTYMYYSGELAIAVVNLVSLLQS